MPRKFKYYDIRDILKLYPECQYYIVIGERSNGKTYSALDLAVENYFKTGEQFAYLRRFNLDIKPKNLKQLFAAHIENEVINKYSGGKFNSVNYTSGRFTPRLVLPDDSETIENHEPFGFAFDLASMEHYKSISFPKVTTIIFDEFMSREGYLANEFMLFTNALSTIIRQRDNVKIIMLGNTVNKFCPYFTEMGLKHIKDQKQGTIDLYKFGADDVDKKALRVAVEYCSSSKSRGGKKSDVYFAFDNPQLEMITGGAWEISIYPHLETKYRPKDVFQNFFIQFDGALLHGEMVATDSQLYCFIHPKTTPIKDETEDVVYCDRPDQRWNWKTCLTKQSDKLSTLIMKLFRENKIFYSDNETGEVVRNYMIWCDTYSFKR